MTSAAAALADRLRSATRVNDPLLGDTTPREMQAGSPLWPGAQWSVVERVAVTDATPRRLEEYMFTGQDGSRLPVAVMFDESAGEDGPAARVYSAHHLTASRAPLLPVDPHVRAATREGDFLAGYFDPLRAGDLEATLATFEEDGYIQHSAGDRYEDAEGRRKDYVHMLEVNGGSVYVNFCNVTDDGRRRAFECVMQSGRPGVAVYEPGRTGRIGAVRIYL